VINGIIIRVQGDTREVPESPRRLVHRAFFCIRVNAVLACIHIHMLMGTVALMIPISKLAAKKKKSGLHRTGSSSELRDVEWRPCSSPFPSPHGLLISVLIKTFLLLHTCLERCILLHKAKCTDKIDVPQRGMISRSTIHLQLCLHTYME
jgi:hypothetical protein